MPTIGRGTLAWRTEAQAAAGADGVPRQRLDAQEAAAKELITDHASLTRKSHANEHAHEHAHPYSHARTHA